MSVNCIVYSALNENVVLIFVRKDEDDDDEQQEKTAKTAIEIDATAEAKQTEGELNDDDEAMPEKTNDNLNNGSPDDETQSQTGNNDGDDSKELADGEIADLSGDESKADAPETIDLGMFPLN